MNPEIEKLIDFALSDGILSDKEKNLLYKKADELGVDKDEFEMVLEGKLHQVERQKKQISKCPQCGEPIYGLTKVCSACGFILNIKNLKDDELGNLDDAIHKIQRLIVQVKSVPNLTFFERLKSIGIIVILLGIFSNIILMIQEGSFIKAIFIFLLSIGGFWVFKRFSSNKNSSFEKLVAESEMQKNLIMTYYGENKKVSSYVNDLETEILKIKNERKLKIRKTNIGCLSLIVLIFLFYLILVGVIFKFAFNSNQDKEYDNSKIDSLLSIGKTEDAKIEASKLSIEYQKDKAQDKIKIYEFKRLHETGDKVNAIKMAKSIKSQSDRNDALDKMTIQEVEEFLKNFNVEAAKNIVNSITNENDRKRKLDDILVVEIYKLMNIEDYKGAMVKAKLVNSDYARKRYIDEINTHIK